MVTSAISVFEATLPFSPMPEVQQWSGELRDARAPNLWRYWWEGKLDWGKKNATRVVVLGAFPATTKLVSQRARQEHAVRLQQAFAGSTAKITMPWVPELFLDQTGSVRYPPVSSAIIAVDSPKGHPLSISVKLPFAGATEKKLWWLATVNTGTHSLTWEVEVTANRLYKLELAVWEIEEGFANSYATIYGVELPLTSLIPLPKPEMTKDHRR